MVEKMRLLSENNNHHRRRQTAASKGDRKRLWRTTKHTADSVAVFFRDKVEALRYSTAATPLYNVPHRATSTISQWATVTVDEVQKLIKSALNKRCQLDPAHSWLVKDMCDLSPFITVMFNKSLDTAVSRRNSSRQSSDHLWRKPSSTTAI